MQCGEFHDDMNNKLLKVHSKQFSLINGGIANCSANTYLPEK